MVVTSTPPFAERGQPHALPSLGGQSALATRRKHQARGGRPSDRRERIPLYTAHTGVGGSKGLHGFKTLTILRLVAGAVVARSGRLRAWVARRSVARLRLRRLRHGADSRLVARGLIMFHQPRPPSSGSFCSHVGLVHRRAATAPPSSISMRHRRGSCIGASALISRRCQSALPLSTRREASAARVFTPIFFIVATRC